MENEIIQITQEDDDSYESIVMHARDIVTFHFRYGKNGYTNIDEVEISCVNGEVKTIQIAVPTKFRIINFEEVVCDTDKVTLFEEAYLGALAEGFAKQRKERLKDN